MKNGGKRFQFHLPAVDRAIVEALRSSVEDIMPEIMNENNLTERNGYAQFRWNPIITQLRDQCRQLGWLDLSALSRGGWNTPVLFHAASRNILTLMAEGTFRRVQKKSARGTHYLCGGASFNQGLEAQYEQLELELPGISPDAAVWVAKSREELATAIRVDVDEIAGHILVLFEARDDKLLTVRALRLTPALAISTEEEDWSRYIQMPYAADQTIEPQRGSEDEEEELVALL